MAADPPYADKEIPIQRVRLPGGEVVAARSRAPSIVLERGMLSHQFWLCGERGAMRLGERPPEWDGEAHWWLPESDRRAGLLALLPDLMPWLPPTLDAPNKLQIADCMAFPQPHYVSWDEDERAARRPFVDAVFVDDAAHLHLVDATPADGDATRTFQRWNENLKSRELGLHWRRDHSPSSPFEAEYAKLCWLRNQAPLEEVCRLLDSVGDEMPDRTVQAFWNQLGRHCRSYWNPSSSYDQKDKPHCILVTDGDVGDDAPLMQASVYDNVTLACVTPFVVDGASWLRVDVRAWSGYGTSGLLIESPTLAERRRCRMAGATDVGKRRTANQDALQWSEADGWAAVADGMGGHPNGDVASATVLRVFGDAMAQWPDPKALLPRRHIARRLHTAAVQGNAELWKENKDKSIFGRMGTTFSALRLHGDQVSVAHAGDSRIYEFTPGDSYTAPRLRMLTQDHGEHGGLDRALGMWERIPFDMETQSIPSYVLYVLCTDGLTNMIDYDDILTLCQRHGGRDSDLQGLVAALIDAANEAGGNDNITVCVVEVSEPRE